MRIGKLCCGTTTYDPKRTLCCDGKMYEGPIEILEQSECCSQFLYNPDTQLCCSAKPNGDDLEEEISVVVEKLTPNYECCGLIGYNPKLQVCCHRMDRPSVVLPIKDNATECCGKGDYTELYNPAYEKCCGKIIALRNEACCGRKKYFTPSYQLCCLDREESYTVLNKSVGVFKRQASSTGITTCCNGAIYDSTHYDCCGGKVIPFYKDQGCCNGRLFNKKSEFCSTHQSSMTVVRKTHPSHDEPCGDQPFSSKTHMCCPTMKGLVLSKKTREKADTCCGNKAFHKSEGICCVFEVQYRLYEVNPFTHSCCGIQVIDTSTHICCDNRIHPQNKMMGKKCCGGELYDMKNQLCCNDIIIPRSRDRNFCCDANMTRDDIPPEKRRRALRDRAKQRSLLKAYQAHNHE